MHSSTRFPTIYGLVKQIKIDTIQARQNNKINCYFQNELDNQVFYFPLNVYKTLCMSTLFETEDVSSV